MAKILAELLIATLLVAGATLAAHRWGARVGGLVSAFPAVVGPVLLIVAQQRGAVFAAHAATGTLIGLVALSGFALAYARAARHAGWQVSLFVGWVCAALLGAIIGLVGRGVGVAGATAAAVVSLASAYWAIPQPLRSHPAAPRVLSRGREIILRMVATGALVAALAAAAERLGPLVGGMLAALPALASVLAAFTHRGYGADSVAALLRGMLVGMVAFVGFCLVVATLVVSAGIATAFGLAALTAVGLQALGLDSRIGFSRAPRSQAAPQLFRVGQRDQPGHAAEEPESVAA